MRRIRRWSGRAGLGGLVSMAVVAAAIAIPLTHGKPDPVIGPTLTPAREWALSYTVTVNGRTQASTDFGHPAPTFNVDPGRTITIRVKVIVPRSRPVPGPWLAKPKGALNFHLGSQLLAGRPTPLRPGAYRFVLHWNVPTGLPLGTELPLTWALRFSGTGHGGIHGPIAGFLLVLPPPTTPGSPAAGRLRALVLGTVTSCNGEAPASILAVRTTFGKALAVTDGYGDNETGAVYLVVVKGDLDFRGQVVRPSCQALAEPYFMIIVDATTFEILEDPLSPYPPKEPMSALGRPVLNLTHGPSR